MKMNVRVAQIVIVSAIFASGCFLAATSMQGARNNPVLIR